MRLGLSLLAACVAFALASVPTRTAACSLPGPVPHAIDPALRAVDQTPPAAPRVGAITIARGRGAQGCGASSSCDDLGTVGFEVSSSDDRTAAQELGYRLVARGAVPAGLSVPAEPVRADAAGRLLLAWVDGSTNDQEALHFELEIVAVDEAGNESPVTTLELGDERTGCSAAGSSAVGGGMLVLLVGLTLGSCRRRAGLPNAGRSRQRSGDK